METAPQIAAGQNGAKRRDAKNATPAEPTVGV
jgi:hypothetical protein